MRRARPSPCNCLVVRQAARHVSQLYDRCLAPYGLKAGQYGDSRDARARGADGDQRARRGAGDGPRRRSGATCGRCSATAISPSPSRPPTAGAGSCSLTSKGRKLLERAYEGWAEAQAEFARAFGEAPAGAFRDMMQRVVATPLGG